MRLRRTSDGRGARRSGVFVGCAAAVVALSLLSGCSSDDPSDAVASTGPTVSISEPPSTATTTSATSPASPSTSVTSVTTPTPSATPKVTKTRWPQALGEPQHGDSAWAVYLAVAHSSSDAGLQAAQDQAAQFGYGPIIGDLACDHGAIEALGLDPHDYWTGAVLYFGNEQDARDFARSYLASGGTVIGSAKIGLGCLD